MSGPFSLHNWEAWFSDWSFFASGFLRTLYISLLGLIFTLIIGLVVGILLCGKHKVVLALCRGYMPPTGLLYNQPGVFSTGLFRAAAAARCRLTD